MSICFCTLAIHAAYRRRARLLCNDARQIPWIVLTDKPEDFGDLPVRTIRHTPTGPMAEDYLRGLVQTGDEGSAAAYHDKRYALVAALESFDTAIYVDADSRILDLELLETFPAGIAAISLNMNSISEHLAAYGSWRTSHFVELAKHLTGKADILHTAKWCPEMFFAITKDGCESRFFEVWALAAEFMHARGVFSGEGGVIGLAAATVGWEINYTVLERLGRSIQHEGGGPKTI